MVEDGPAATKGERETSPPGEAGSRLLVRIEPVCGEEVIAWLERAAALGADGVITLVRFDAESATLSVARDALGRLGDVLNASVAIAFPAEAPASALAQPPETPVLPTIDEQPEEADEPPQRSRIRSLWLAALTIALCALAGSIPALCIVRRGELPDLSFLRSNPKAEPSRATGIARPGGQRGADRIRRVERNFEGACLPELAEAACSPLRAALWQGDADAWRQWATAQGETPPAPAEVVRRTIELRLAANDPAARSSIARGAGLPLPLIGTLTLRESESNLARVEGVEIVNAGGAVANLSGVRLEGLGRIVDGFVLPAGQRCGLGALAVGPSCPLAPGEVTTNLHPGEVLRLVGADGRVLDTLPVPR